jgi:U3 small nucleolar RNA-associated protein 10
MTSLAEQLSQVAAKSANSLNLKAQKAAHSRSLIFEPRVAASQDFDTIYTICLEGFQELCQLDPRFVRFERSIFSRQSKNEERNQLTKKENEELDTVLEEFLGLVGARLLLKPGLKAVEWLVRRFRYAVCCLVLRNPPAIWSAPGVPGCRTFCVPCTTSLL